MKKMNQRLVTAMLLEKARAGFQILSAQAMSLYVFLSADSLRTP